MHLWEAVPASPTDVFGEGVRESRQTLLGEAEKSPKAFLGEGVRESQKGFLGEAEKSPKAFLGEAVAADKKVYVTFYPHALDSVGGEKAERDNTDTHAVDTNGRHMAGNS
jgi:hypothetical protein